MRCSELTISSKFDPAINPTISDLTILDSETISFLVKQVKQTKSKKGHFVYIFNLSSPIQPYQAVREYLRLRISQAKSPLEPLFLDNTYKPASRAWFQKHLRSVLLAAGISAKNFSSHSFRIGAATSAAQKGLTKHQIQTLGRWSSEAFQSYIRTDQFHIKLAHQTLISKKKKKKKTHTRCELSWLLLNLSKPHAWRGSPFWHPVQLWPEPPNQKLAFFHPAAGESHPSRPRVSISGQVTASASRPPNFTFPSLPVRHRVLISRRTPARASRPDNLTFSTPRPTYLSVFTCPTQRASTSRRTPARASRPDNLAFSSPTLATLIRPKQWVGESFHSQTILPSMSHARRGLPVRLGDYRSQRRREPPSQTTHLFCQLAPPFEPRRTLHTRPFKQP